MDISIGSQKKTLKSLENSFWILREKKSDFELSQSLVN